MFGLASVIQHKGLGKLPLRNRSQNRLEDCSTDPLHSLRLTKDRYTRRQSCWHFCYWYWNTGQTNQYIKQERHHAGNLPSRSSEEWHCPSSLLRLTGLYMDQPLSSADHQGYEGLTINVNQFQPYFTYILWTMGRNHAKSGSIHISRSYIKKQPCISFSIGCIMQFFFYHFTSIVNSS